MRKKLQDKMFEMTYIFELFTSLIVGIAIIIFSVRMFADVFDKSAFENCVGSLVKILDDAIILAIGAEFIKMLCKHTPETVIEVIAFALARQLIVGHAGPLENFVTVASIAVLFAVRRFLLKKHDMVETPEGLVENDVKENSEKLEERELVLNK